MEWKNLSHQIQKVTNKPKKTEPNTHSHETIDILAIDVPPFHFMPYLSKKTKQKSSELQMSELY